MRSEIQKLREDRFTFLFDVGERPVIEAGYGTERYKAVVLSVYARFTPEGELLSVNPRAKKIKKDGTPSQASATVHWEYHDLDEQARQWRSEALAAQEGDRG